MANGLPSFTLVGLADVEVKEARERVRCAIQNAGLEFPHNKRITVNLAPADLPKDSGRLDLPIALGILAASGQIDGAGLAAYEFAGELSLSGALRPVRGALAMGLALHTAGVRSALVLPPGSAEEAALVPGSRVYRAAHLLDVVRQFLPSANQENPPDSDEGWTRLHTSAPALAVGGPDLADVKGQTGAKRALEIAAAGGHSLLLVGSPGAGKSMLAQRFAGLLPDMSTEQALESAAISSLSGRFSMERWGQRPTCSPHHSASAVALVGGGSPPRPGEISMAHNGVLFLDEFPEFARSALEAPSSPRAFIPRALSIGRGHEPLPLRLPGQRAAVLPLHTGSGAPLPEQTQWPLDGPHRLACGSASAGAEGTIASSTRRIQRRDPQPLYRRTRPRNTATRQTQPGAGRSRH
jgi:magnesium chelatase family protein